MGGAEIVAVADRPGNAVVLDATDAPTGKRGRAFAFGAALRRTGAKAREADHPSSAG